MQCPKCKARMRKIESSMGSNFHGSDAEPSIISGYSCEPAGCGNWIDYVAPAKPLDIKQPCGTGMQNAGNSRQESQVTAKMRCDDYFEKFKYQFKEQLVLGKTFKAIWIDIKENNIDLPSRSWLRQRYLAWIKTEVE